MNKIQYRFKILYAIAMIMVVAGHCAHYGGLRFLTIKGLFPFSGLHLALFVFVSGYFFDMTSTESVLSYIKRKSYKLLLPLYLYNLFYAFVVWISRYKAFKIGRDISFDSLVIQPITNGHQFGYNMGGWFVVPLMLILVLFSIYKKCFRNVEIYVSIRNAFLGSIVLGLFGNYLASIGYNKGIFLVIVRTLYFLPIFALGIFYHYVLENYDRKIRNLIYLIAIISAKLLIVYYYDKSPTYTPSWCNDFVNGPVMPIIVAFLGIAFWLRIVTILEKYICKNTVIDSIANNTYSLMINQFLGFMLVKGLCGFVSKHTGYFQDFNWLSFKTNIWYYYFPKGHKEFLLLYVVAGLLLPILMQKYLNNLRDYCQQSRCKKIVNFNNLFRNW